MSSYRTVEFPWVLSEPLLERALTKSMAAWAPAFKGLPVPVRFRASGALRAWEIAAEKIPDMLAAQELISNPNTSPNDAFLSLAHVVSNRIVGTGTAHLWYSKLRNTLSIACSMLAFWWRNGALYEPTLALGTLLGGSDIAQDLPLRLLQPLVPALAILPPWQQRHHCAGSSCVLLFERRESTLSSERRQLCWMNFHVADSGISGDGFDLDIGNEDDFLMPAANEALADRHATLSASHYTQVLN